MEHASPARSVLLSSQHRLHTAVLRGVHDKACRGVLGIMDWSADNGVPTVAGRAHGGPQAGSACQERKVRAAPPWRPWPVSLRPGVTCVQQ